MLGLAKRLAAFFEDKSKAPELITVDALIREVLFQRSSPNARRRIVAEANRASKLLLESGILLVPVLKTKMSNGSLIAGYIVGTKDSHDIVIRTLAHYHRLHKSKGAILAKQVRVATAVGLLTDEETIKVLALPLFDA